MRPDWIGLRAALLTLLAMTLVSLAHGHPEDEFCIPGEGGLDPALCQALSELDRPGEVSGAAPPPVTLERSAGATFATYVAIGVRHILPGGLDHILFVLAFFLSSRRLQTLLLQIGVFTVAHTVTLGLAASGVISPPASVVEPLIALSIAWVAIENVLGRDVGRARTALIFLFGLVHGMGFAGFFGELGLPQGSFLSALLGFNVGVELGQLVVVFVALTLTWPWRPLTERAAPGYRRQVVIPASMAIAVVALYWTVERMIGA